MNSSTISSTLRTIGIPNPQDVAGWEAALLAAGICVSATVLVSWKSSGKEAVPRTRGFPIVGEWAFFTRRHRFLEDGLRKFGKMFKFNILQHEVIAVSGEEARKVFFGSRELDAQEGYSVLFGGAPLVKDLKLQREYEDGDMTWFGKRILNILKRERLAVMIPALIDDVDRAMGRWGNSGTFNPFEDVYAMIFQLTIRAGSCVEIANDPDAVKRVTELYWQVERGSSATSVLLPWFPSRARKLKNQATAELYGILKTHIDDRTATGRTEVDAMQVLLDMGDGTTDIVQFILGVLFAGIINTGIMSSWILLFLHNTPTWKAKAINEIKTFIAQYAPNDAPNLAAKLSAIPPEIWDDNMPVLDLCLRETIRIVMTGAALRRVMTDNIVIDGVRIERGTFLAFLMSGTHENPEIYDDPEKWDPSRYERGDDTKQHWGYLGWGVGRHPCLGMRFAKLEIKIILALFLMRYEYTVVDSSNRPMEVLPKPYRDNMYQVPPSEPAFIKYKRQDKL